MQWPRLLLHLGIVFEIIMHAQLIHVAKALNNPAKIPKIGVIGGGASGMFSAAQASAIIRQNNVNAQVHVLEATSTLMNKVRISGGGRCNVLHDTSKPVSVLLNGYPRGKKELTGLFKKHFSPSDAEKWFRDRGVELKTEQDGRMFPITDSSQTIINCIKDSTLRHDVQINTRQKVISVESNQQREQQGDEESCGSAGFTVSLRNGETKEDHQEYYDRIIIATGSNPGSYELCKNLGHNIIPPVPSLFTFNTKNQNKEGQIFHNLSGLSVQSTIVTLKMKVEGKKKKKILQQEGPLLITHHGISGPAPLRLSAFAAREFKEMNYRGDVFVHWAPEFGSATEIESLLWSMTSLAPKKKITSVCPLMDESNSSVIPKRLWSALVIESGFDGTEIWAEAKKKKVGALSRTIAEFVVDVTGKGVFKEEFVTAGGVSLKELDMKTLESKKCPGLYFCGEVIDVDGVTGGFNFMNCWATGFMAGTNSALSIVEDES